MHRWRWIVVHGIRMPHRQSPKQHRAQTNRKLPLPLRETMPKLKSSGGKSPRFNGSERNSKARGVVVAALSHEMTIKRYARASPRKTIRAIIYFLFKRTVL